MITFSLPSESFPISTKISKDLTTLSDLVLSTTGKPANARALRTLASKDKFTTEDMERLYKIECRMTRINRGTAAAIYAVRIDLAHNFLNEFYKDPQTGYGYQEEDED